MTAHWPRLLRSPRGLIAVTVLVLLAVAGVVVAALGPSPTAQFASGRLLSPSLHHPFGTDELRRDLLARTAAGAWTSLSVAVIGVGIGAPLGSAVGLVAGSSARLVDAMAMRLVDGLLAIPDLLLALAIVAAVGSGERSVISAVALVNATVYARIARGLVLVEERKGYVSAATALGVRPREILFRHIGPNVFPHLATQAPVALVGAVLLEAGLSFLGLGIRPPTPTLGALLGGSRSYWGAAWWYPLFPAIALGLTTLCFSLLADAVQDAGRRR